MDKDKIVTYLMNTPYNTNWAVLKGMLGEGDWSGFKKHIEKNLGSMNVGVVGSILGEGNKGDETEGLFKTVNIDRNNIVDDSDLITVEDIIEYIIDNYELEPWFSTFRAVLKEGGVPIHFNYLYDGQLQFTCEGITTNQIRASSIYGTDISEVSELNFPSTENSNIGIRVINDKFGYKSVFKYDDTE